MPYDPQFIPGIDLPLPTLAPSILATAFDNGTPVGHPRFSIIFSETRGFAIVTAHNIDGSNLIAEGVIQRNDAFRFDTQVPNDIQIDDDQGYRGSPTQADNPWDRGHLVRRRSLHWGNEQEARQADRDSFFWTNIVPQHEDLHDTAWGSIEDFMLQAALDADRRACVFQGPVLTANDPVIVNMPGEDPFQLPAGFWKVFCIRHNNELRAACFLVWQRDFDALDMSFDPVLEQVRITTIEYLTGLTFTDNVRQADPLRFSATAAGGGAQGAGVAPAGASAEVAGAVAAATRPRGGAIRTIRDIQL